MAKDQDIERVKNLHCNVDAMRGEYVELLKRPSEDRYESNAGLSPPLTSLQNGLAKEFRPHPAIRQNASPNLPLSGYTI